MVPPVRQTFMLVFVTPNCKHVTIKDFYSVRLYYYLFSYFHAKNMSALTIPLLHMSVSIHNAGMDDSANFCSLSLSLSIERSGSGVELRTLDYENPGSNPGCGVKTLGKFFHSTLLQFTQLN